MNEELRLLLVEDNQADVDLIREMLSETGPVSFKIESLPRLSDALNRLKDGNIDLVLLDLGLPDSKGLETFHTLQEYAHGIATVVLSGNTNKELAIAAVKDGAQDYLVKGEIGGGLLVRSIRYAMERKRAEEALRQSEEKFRGLFESSRDALMTLEPPSWTFTSGNPAMIEMFRAKNEEEFISYTPVDLSPEQQPDGSASAEKAGQMIETAMREGSHFFEWTHKRINGEEFPATVLLTRIEVAGKRFLQATVRDITEQKRAEENLRQSEEKFRRVIETALEGVWFLDSELKTTEVNDAIVRLLGYAPKELIGRPFIDFVIDEERPMQVQEFQQRKRGISGQYERRLRCKNGSVKWLFLSAKAVMSAQGAFVGTFAMITDITERKLAEETLRQSEARYRILFEQAADIILQMEITPEGMPVIRDVNSATSRLLGYKRDELVGQPVSFLEAAPDASKVVNERRQNVLSGTGTVFESRHRCKDGTVRDFECSVSEMRAGSKTFAISVERDITDRKKAAESLRQSEEKFKRLFEESPSGIAMMDTEGLLLEANRSLLKLLNLGREELVGKNFTVLAARFGLNTREQIADFGQRLTGGTAMNELTFSNRDGKQTTITVQSATIMSKGQATGVLYIVNDITERKLAEDAQRRNARDMEFLSRSAMALVELTSVKDVYQYIGELLREIVPEKSVLAVSEFDEFSLKFHPRNIIGLDKTIGMIKKILGKDPMELSGDFGPAAKKALLSGKLQKIDVGLHDFAETIPESIGRAVEKLLGIKALYVIGFVKEGKVVGGLSIILRKESALANPGVIEAFAAQAAIAIAKRKAEQALRESEERYRTLFDDAKDGIALTDAETGRIVECNQALCSMAEKDKMELLGQMQSVLHPSQPLVNGLSPTFVKHKASDPGKSLEDQLISKSNKLINVEIRAAKVHMNGHDYILGSFRDISERKQHESEKEGLLGQLLQAQKMEAVGTLAGGVAHDFNNLLTAISGYTSLAMGKIDQADPVQRDLKQVSIAAAKAAGVTRQLLLFSRKQHMEPVPVNLNDAISHLLKMLDRLIGEDIVIETNLEKELWSIMGDEGNIEQVLMNLSVNARDAMPSGGKLFIKTENKTIDAEYCRGCKGGRPGRFVCLSVSDTGTGMDEMTMDHMFEPFFTTKGEGKGTGLGLSVVFGIIEQHKGWINVYSEPGHGTTFKAYFPSSSARPEQKSKDEVSLSSLQGKGERIMIVEDQTEVRELAKEILAANGYSVFPVSSAKEAMELFEKENGKFDLVFSDVVLTDTSGILLVEDLLKRWKFRVLITSGYTDEKANWDLIKEKKHHFLHKPYTMHALLQAVKEVLDEKKS